MAQVDFFISYTKADQAMAEWIAWQLEAAGYTTVIQTWDFRPGSEFITQMQQALVDADSVNLPDELLTALEQDQLVIFAGAGTSMSPPSSFPSFHQLAEQIAQDAQRPSPTRHGGSQ